MSESCDSFRNKMPNAILEDLSSESRQSLEAHLADCPACQIEWELWSTTVGQLRAVEMVAVPRHFFVHAEQPKAKPWQMFQQLSLAWKTSVALAALLMACGGILAASRAHFHVSQGVYSLSFGPPSNLMNSQNPSPASIEEMKREILTALDQRLQAERLQTVRWIESELVSTTGRMNRQQAQLLKARFEKLDARLDERLKATGTFLQARSDRELADLYGTVQAQRQQDLLQINASLNRLVAAGEVKDTRTVAILDTLLQVAQLKLQ